MTCQPGCVVREAHCGVVLGKTEEGVAEVMDIEDGDVVINHVSHVEEDLITTAQHSGRCRLVVPRRTSSKPSRSQRLLQQKERRKAYSCLEASRKGVRSSPRTMTRSGQALRAS